MDPMQINTTAEENVHLAHELGHCLTGSFYNPSSTHDLIEKHEWRAEKKAIKMLIPADELKEAFSHGITEVWELAEYFNLTEDYIQKAYRYYKDNNLLNMD